MKSFFVTTDLINVLTIQREKSVHSFSIRRDSPSSCVHAIGWRSVYVLNSSAHHLTFSGFRLKAKSNAG